MPNPSVFEIFWVFLRLGLTSFGGPIAHLGYFREAFVVRRQWLSDQSYADLVALCQFLPGPASSQVGIGIGLSKGGLAGAFAAWVAFTLPSALLLMGFAYGVMYWSAETLNSGWLHGLKVVAVAIVAQAVWGMANSLCADRVRMTVAVLACCMVLLLPMAGAQVLVIVLGGLFGWRFLSVEAKAEAEAVWSVPLSRRVGGILLAVFFALLLLLPVLAELLGWRWLQLVDSFYRAGALVFGGGHVVLPLLQAEVVAVDQVSSELFLAGYGAAQAVPGPLFTFAGYLGSVMSSAPTGVVGGVLALLAIFLPAFLLVLGALPFWQVLREQVAMRSALAGVNAAVVGVLLAALYDPVWTTAIRSAEDFVLALLAVLLLLWWRVSAGWVVVFAAVSGAVFF